jgi:hypothetical protein
VGKPSERLMRIEILLADGMPVAHLWNRMDDGGRVGEAREPGVGLV